MSSRKMGPPPGRRALTVRNTQWSKQFLQELASWEFRRRPGWSNLENDILLKYLSYKLIPGGMLDYTECLEHWRRMYNYDISSPCPRLVLGFQRFWPGKVRIYRKAHGWAREAFVSSNFWTDSDFMLHDWEEDSAEDVWISPYHDEHDPSVCAVKEKGWKWLPNKYINSSVVRSDLRALEEMIRQNYRNDKIVSHMLVELEVWKCYPHCEED
ncbi:unnamed protein product [Strongylus vulgaris]|uniref:Uncharacterized protein n=1 Tax=Strongylus vulgaris TaxID=40348 RepID=A0A3P7J2A7_STRVU|nr:unnamed protein product [Strongylus vulgaris]